MGNYIMTFPDTVEEFMEEYKMVDEDHVYSNGTEYVPIFRMKQWFKHLEALKAQDKGLDQWCTDCKEYDTEKHCCPRFNKVIRTALSELPSAEKRTEEHTETHECDLPSAEAIIRCKDCKHWKRQVGTASDGLGDCKYHRWELVTSNGYCFWAERRTDDSGRVDK